MKDAEYLRDRFKREHRDMIQNGCYDPLALVGFAVKVMYEERKILKEEVLLERDTDAYTRTEDKLLLPILR